MNPAFVGYHENDWNLYNRFNSRYVVFQNALHNVWLSGDYQIYFKQNKLSLGGSVTHEQLSTGPVTENQLEIYLAYHKVYRRNTFRIGIQPGLFFRGVVFNELTFPDQYSRDFGQFVNNTSTNENIGNETTNAFNINAGLLWTHNFKKFYSDIGVGIFKLNKPDLSFSTQNYYLPTTIDFHIRINYPVRDKNIIIPFVNYQLTENVQEFIIGSSYSYLLRKNSIVIKSITIGNYLMFRSNNYPNYYNIQIGTKLHKLDINFAYVVAFAANNKIPNNYNHFEISVVLNGFRPNIEKYHIPCEIY